MKKIIAGLTVCAALLTSFPVMSASHVNVYYPQQERSRAHWNNNNWDNNRSMNRSWNGERGNRHHRDRGFNNLEAGAAAIGLFTTIINNSERRNGREWRERRFRNDNNSYPCWVYDPDVGRSVRATCFR